MASSRYETEPRSRMADYLKNNSDKHFTVDDLTESLCAQGRRVGRTTVYRNLERLVREGSVQRFDTPGAPACYQYVSGNGCAEHHHLHCTSCGTLIHVDCDYMDELKEHIKSEHGFAVDAGRTVLYGLCEKCRDGEHRE
ncbi:MAG: Ferric uptake regulation protein [Firmicutes bacterium ADurb.Bin182]|nr:MAG: Ferric uptake regulation protein [Firmicutes bacterium ADurb.Bin182]